MQRSATGEWTGRSVCSMYTWSCTNWKAHLSNISCRRGSAGHVPPLASRPLGSSIRSDRLDDVDLDVGVESSKESLDIGVDIQTSLANVQNRDVGHVVILPLTLLLLRLKEIPRTGPRWIRFIKWVVKPAILFRRRLEGMTATSSARHLLV